MNKNLQNIEELYKKLLEKHTEMPPPSVWDNINKNLDEKNIISLKRKYTDLKKLTALLLILCISAVAYYYGSDKKFVSKVKPVIIEEQVSEQKKLDKNINIIIDPTKKINSQNDIPYHKNDSTYEEFADEKIYIINSTSNGSIESKNNLVKSEFIPGTRKTLKDDLTETKKNKELTKIRKISTGLPIVIKNTLSNTNKKIIFTEQIKEQEEKGSSNKLSASNTELKETTLYDELTTVKNYTSLKNKRSNNKVKIAATLKIIEDYKKDHEKIIYNINKINAQPILATHLLKIGQLKVPGLKDAILKSYNNKLLNSKFSITIYASPELAFNRIEDDKKIGNNGPQGTRPPDDRHKIKQEEQQTKSFSTGVLIDYAFTNKWSIQSGISVISKSSKTEPKKVFAELDNNGNIKYKYNCAFGSSFISPKTGTAPAVGDSATANFTNNNIRYIGIPLNFSYQLKIGKLQISPTVGVTFNFLVKQGTVTGITDAFGSQKENSQIINGLKSNYFNANFGMNINYWLTKKLALILAPSTSIALNSVNQNGAVRSYPNSFGIRSGLKVNF